MLFILFSHGFRVIGLLARFVNGLLMAVIGNVIGLLMGIVIGSVIGMLLACPGRCTL